MTATAQTKTVRSPAQLAAIRRSIGRKIGEAARAAARKRHIQKWLDEKIQKERIESWKTKKIKAYYAAKPAKAAA